MTDSDFNTITSMDVVFSPDKATNTQKLTATNPGTYYWNDIIRNSGSTPLTVTVNLSIPASTNPAMAQAFCLKGSMPIQVYSDLMRTNDVTSTATISPAEPLGGSTAQSLYCTSTVSVTVTIPAGGLRYVTVHLDFQPKGSTGFPSNASSTYVQGFLFHQTGTVPCDTTFTAAGKNVTGIGGFALDSNLNSKGGLNAQLIQSGSKIKDADTSATDGFYYLQAGPGTYTVKLVNAQNMVLATSAQVSLTSGLYVQNDFTNLNPADPVIEGFVADVNGKGIAGATVNLYNNPNVVMQSAVTSSSGHYSFRFANPGTFTLTVTPPTGYTAPAPATVTLKQFDDARLDFKLTKS